MAQQSKTRWAQLKVGVLAIVALIVLGYLIFLLSGSHGFFKSKSTLYAFFGDSAAITDGSPVRLNGIVVGRVRHVGLSGSTELGRIVKLDLEIDNEFMASIPIDSQAGITAQNLLATKSINIKKGHSPISVKDGTELKSFDTPELEDLFAQGYTSLGSLDAILKKMDGIIDSIQVGKGTIGKLLSDETLYNRLLAIVDEANKMVAALNSDQNSVGRVLHDNGEMYASLKDSIGRINTLVDDVDHGPGVVGKLIQDPTLYNEINKTVGDVRKMLADLDAGKGTVGKLLKSDDLHNQIQATIGRLDGILDKINSGQGTIGQLLVNPALYDSLDGTTRELHGLLKDFRSNPKKFLHIKIGLF